MEADINIIITSNIMMVSNNVLAIILTLSSAAAIGLMGGFALMKRMTLAGDVMSHITLPGIGLALVFNLNPLLGAATTLLLGAILIARLERYGAIATETAIGVIFTAAVAVGVLISPPEQLIEALFGGLGAMDLTTFVIGMIVTLVVLVALLKLRGKLLLSLFSPDLAVSTGVNVSRLNLTYLLLFSLTILLGLRFLGAILVGALIITSGAIARQLTHNLQSFLSISVASSVLSVALGMFISNQYGSELGPTIVSVAAGIFVLSLLKKKW